MVEELQKKKIVSKDETIEFVKTFKRSEYSVVEQLKKLSVHISILFLLLPSEAHQNPQLKILNEPDGPRRDSKKGS